MPRRKEGGRRFNLIFDAGSAAALDRFCALTGVLASTAVRRAVRLQMHLAEREADGWRIELVRGDERRRVVLLE